MLDFTLIGALLALITILPLAWKWCLGMRRTAFVVFSLALLSGLLVALLNFLRMEKIRLFIEG